MQQHYHDIEENNESTSGQEAREEIGDNAFLDLTDRKNDEFVYIY